MGYRWQSVTLLKLIQDPRFTYHLINAGQTALVVAAIAECREGWPKTPTHKQEISRSLRLTQPCRSPFPTPSYEHSLTCLTKEGPQLWCRIVATLYSKAFIPSKVPYSTSAAFVSPILRAERRRYSRPITPNDPSLIATWRHWWKRNASTMPVTHFAVPDTYRYLNGFSSYHQYDFLVSCRRLLE